LETEIFLSTISTLLLLSALCQSNFVQWQGIIVATFVRRSSLLIARQEGWVGRGKVRRRGLLFLQRLCGM
jgi:hypothetical protein